MKNNKIILVLGCVILVAVYLALRINSLDIPLERDEGIFGYAGEVILQNGLPYKDIFEIKPPVVFYINALALSLFPSSSTGIHAFLCVYNFLTLIVLFFIGKALTRSNTAGFLVAITYAVVSSLPIVQGFTASTEMFLLLPLSLCLLTMIYGIRKRNIFLIFSSGLFGSITFWTKAPSLSMIAFIGVYFTFFYKPDLSQKPFPLNPVKNFIFWSGGFLAFSLLLAGYFLYKGVFDKFIYWSFTHSYLYSKLAETESFLPIIKTRLLRIAGASFFVLIAGIAGCWIKIKEKNQASYFAVGFLVFSIPSVIPGFAYKHYFAQLLPALSVFGGLGAYFLNSRLKRAAYITSLTCYILLVVIVPATMYGSYYFKDSPDKISRDYFGINPFPESIDIAKFIENNTTRKDTIFIFGSEPQIFLYSKRKSVTPFVVVYPLMASFPAHKEFQKQVWADVNSKKPKYIITSNIPQSFAYDGKADLWIDKKVNSLLREKYHIDAVVTIEYPKGRLYTRDKLEIYKKDIEKSKYRVFLFKRNL